VALKGFKQRFGKDLCKGLQLPVTGSDTTSGWMQLCQAVHALQALNAERGKHQWCLQPASITEANRRTKPSSNPIDFQSSGAGLTHLLAVVVKCRVVWVSVVVE